MHRRNGSAAGWTFTSDANAEICSKYPTYWRSGKFEAGTLLLITYQAHLSYGHET